MECSPYRLVSARIEHFGGNSGGSFLGLNNARDGAITFGDLVGKLPVLRVNCDKCQRLGRYALQRLIAICGRDGKVID